MFVARPVIYLMFQLECIHSPKLLSGYLVFQIRLSAVFHLKPAKPS